MEKKETEKLFRLVRSVYRKAEDFAETAENADTLLAWTLALELYSYDEVRNAFFCWARSSPFPPKISELVAFMAPKTDARKGSGEAWQARIDAGRCIEAAGTVSRRARERGISWRAAKMEVTV